MNKGDGRAASIESLKFDVRVDKHRTSNVHAEQSRHLRRVILIQDTSGSMRSGGKDISAEVIKSFVASATAEDQIGLVDFNDQYYLDIPPTNAADFSDQYNSPRFQGKISPRGGTALFDAMIASASFLEKEPQEGDSIVIISDGGDNASRRSFQDVRRELVGSDVRIRVYLLLLPAPASGSGFTRSDRSRLDLMDAVRETGGVIGKVGSRDFNVRQWTQTIHGLVEDADKVEFDLDTPLREPARLEMVLSTWDGKRNKDLEVLCPAYLSPVR